MKRPLYNKATWLVNGDYYLEESTSGRVSRGSVLITGFSAAPLECAVCSRSPLNTAQLISATLCVRVCSTVQADVTLCPFYTRCVSQCRVRSTIQADVTVLSIFHSAYIKVQSVFNTISWEQSLFIGRGGLKGQPKLIVRSLTVSWVSQCPRPWNGPESFFLY